MHNPIRYTKVTSYFGLKFPLGGKYVISLYYYYGGTETLLMLPTPHHEIECLSFACFSSNSYQHSPYSCICTGLVSLWEGNVLHLIKPTETETLSDDFKGRLVWHGKKLAWSPFHRTHSEHPYQVNIKCINYFFWIWNHNIWCENLNFCMSWDIWFVSSQLQTKVYSFPQR